MVSNTAQLLNVTMLQKLDDWKENQIQGGKKQNKEVKSSMLAELQNSYNTLVTYFISMLSTLQTT